MILVFEHTYQWHSIAKAWVSFPSVYIDLVFVLVVYVSKPSDITLLFLYQIYSFAVFNQYVSDDQFHPF